ncbi:MAG TPA: ATP-binding protein [Xanthobacteraceae bacterium]|nr:ATP-binding protein [Xanthobacteraceae bacterium]
MSDIGRPRWWLRLGAALLVGLGVLLGIDRLAGMGAERWAAAQVGVAAQSAASFRAAMLRSEIEKQRTLPVVLAQDPDVRAALEGRDPARIAGLNAKLETLAAGTGAGVIYLLDARGVTAAASNYRLPSSFVGSDYSFRPYYLKAMEEGAAEHFALGTVSRQPGLYITRRLDGPQGPLGVLVVKAEFSALEAQWQRAGDPTFVTDARDIVLVTSVPDWRFNATVPIADDQRAAIRASLQFGDATLALLPLRPAVGEGAAVTWAGAAFVEASAPVATIAWTLHVLEPLAATAQLAVLATRALAGLAAVSMLGAGAFILARRRSRAREREREAALRGELEARVAARTMELSRTNERLHTEMEERRRAQATAQTMQDELVQASKLAVLGQIAASVAHEVNQPVAAIRTFADSGAALLERGNSETARKNFATIAALTDRIGAITGQLRAFARKTSSDAGPVELRAVLEGALLLVGHRLRQSGVDLAVDLPLGDLVVAGERGRLEQVFVNLLQNAVEALSGVPEARIRIGAQASGADVVVSIADNGPGLAPQVLDSLFLPFTTTKPEGLGLGLVISHDIVAEFGGSLRAENDGGAVFTLTLRRL